MSFFVFPRQFFDFFVFVSRSFSFLRHFCLIVFRDSTVFRQFSTSVFAFSVILVVSLPLIVSSFISLPLSVVLTLRPCLLSLWFFAFLRQFFYSSVFVSRSFSFLRPCCLIVFRSSTVLRQFSSPLFAFSVVLCVSLSVL